jgi:hypothetical protein
VDEVWTLHLVAVGPSDPRKAEARYWATGFLVGARGFEPLTSSVSGKRSLQTELSALSGKGPGDTGAFEAAPGIEPG